jgi:hypothetical protein
VKRLRPILIALGLVVVLVGALNILTGLRQPVEKPIGYWSISDQMLGVVVLDSPDRACYVAQVEESGDAVRIHVQCLEPVISGAQTAMAQQYIFQVVLQNPLGNRSVSDGTGSPPIACQQPAPDCVIFP